MNPNMGSHSTTTRRDYRKNGVNNGMGQVRYPFSS